MRKRQGIGIFEPVDRSVLSIVSMLLLVPLSTLLVTPLIRPFRRSRLVFTYLIPVLPLLIVFDGTVSCLRVYSPDELRELVAGIDALDYEWQIGTERVPRTTNTLTYLIGTPVSAA